MSLRCWFLREQIFFSVDFDMYCLQPHRTLLLTPSSKTRVKLALLPELLFLTTYTSDSNWYALISVSWFSFLFADSPVAAVDTAMGRSCRLVVSYKKVFLQISQNSQENTHAGVSLIKLQICSVWPYQKKDSGTGIFLWMSLNFSKHLFYRTPSAGCFCTIICSVYFPTATFHLFENSVTHIFRLSIFPA